ncbi:heat shock protein-like protein 30 [Pleomassaria siparia CBS 279.74]|uniref:Heat shock protein-like protein 30 n=1 Tax=Pleomassaria siparia CBS 279.74 TaxID=1314801 RepID=A0A6G1KC33_9PLEO|nr:heat shock protein-like protein 30 [Pleomassaria siparia CBS 279.74]
MQTIRNTIRRIPQQLNRITKPTKGYTTTRPYHYTPATMSLFPRFTQEFTPLFRLIDDYEKAAFRASSPLRTFSPKFDVRELNDSYELHGEFPGIEQKDINIEWTDANTLTITGRHETVREEGTRPTAAIEQGEPTKRIEAANGSSSSAKDKQHQPSAEDESAIQSPEPAEVIQRPDSNEPKYWVSERSVGSFHRSFNFPNRVDQDAVKASLKNGILSVVVPKAKKVEPRRVMIEN